GSLRFPPLGVRPAARSGRRPADWLGGFRRPSARGAPPRFSFLPTAFRSGLCRVGRGFAKSHHQLTHNAGGTSKTRPTLQNTPASALDEQGLGVAGAEHFLQGRNTLKYLLHTVIEQRLHARPAGLAADLLRRSLGERQLADGRGHLHQFVNADAAPVSGLSAVVAATPS